MKRIIKFTLNISILLIIFLALLWLMIARPVIPSSRVYKPEYIKIADALQEHIKYLSEKSIPRSSRHPENLIKTAQYIEKHLMKSSADVSLQYFNANGKQYANVIAKYGPDSPETIIIGAHYDAYSSFPGADDNASGVAGLLELGNLIKNLNLQHRVELIAYTLEEPPYFSSPLMGSALHANKSRLENKKIKIMISLEMIGYFSDDKNSQDYPLKLLNLLYPDRGNFIAIVDQVFSNRARGIKDAINTHTELAAYSINAPAFIAGIDFSDHRNYWANNYPAVMITDTSFYRNKMYHTAGDTYNRLDYKKMEMLIYGIYQYVQTIE